jgi:hypothetical protein
MAAQTPRAPKIPPAFQPPKWEVEDLGALRALERGDALPHQQIRALKFIVEGLAMTFQQSYRPGGLEGDRETAFAEGRRFVGTQIVGLLTIDPNLIKESEDR